MTREEIEKLPYRPGVGIMLVNGEGKVFVGQRKDWAEPAWQMPQGGIDKGEEPETALLRELWEETGVTADLVEILARTDDWIHYDLPSELVGRVWKGKYRGQKQLWYLLRFLGGDDQVNIATEHPEFEAWTWIDAEALVAHIVPFKRALYERVVAELAPRIPSQEGAA
ncbi:RNA pyrophosphohydrolase [Rhodovulum sulfidophilum]|uniref:RNA pyrophosphohydrolase n=1 Tax=Rhodovulum sulfidophilum TaxID=35806 RepID=UPI001F15F8C6|nr:RNA pyrophosphohydrolase [Rhodovulum sulfidophilum]MCE8438469.1 RNA pyrophosphohydrolase [Rhodovulum sulfidophilum]MCE8469494.1 RNA pyrophosphohydrolase [Rhodovulum sulfidophilum]